MTIVKTDKVSKGWKHRIHRANRKKMFKKGIQIRAIVKRRREELIIEDYEKEIRQYGKAHE